MTMHGLMSEAFSTALLSPLSEECPAGEYLKSNRKLYRPLRNAYNVAQTSLHKLSLNPDPSELDELVVSNRENWLQLEKQLLDILQHQSHDLECLVWLAMAQLFTDQPYARLARVIGLLEQTLSTFWSKIQPWLPDDKVRSSDSEGILRERAELQLRPLKLLFGESEGSCQIAVPLRMLPLIKGIDYVCYQREENELKNKKQTLHLQILNQKKEIIERINDMQDVLEAIDVLDSTLIQRFSEVGMTAPGSRFLREQVSANLMAMKNLTGDLILPWPPDLRKFIVVEQEKSVKEAIFDSYEKNALEKNSYGEMGIGGRYRQSDTARQVNPEINEVGVSSLTQSQPTFDREFDRNQAFQQLRLLATFFQRTEPHSPVSYLLEKAIRWGYTSLPELMRELLRGNDEMLDRITDLTGINMTNKAPIPGEPASRLVAVPNGLVEERAIPESETQDKNWVTHGASDDTPTAITETSNHDKEDDDIPDISTPDFENIEYQVAQAELEPTSATSSPQASKSGELSVTNFDDLI